CSQHDDHNRVWATQLLRQQPEKQCETGKVTSNTVKTTASTMTTRTTNTTDQQTDEVRNETLTHTHTHTHPHRLFSLSADLETHPRKSRGDELMVSDHRRSQPNPANQPSTTNTITEQRNERQHTSTQQRRDKEMKARKCSDESSR